MGEAKIDLGFCPRCKSDLEGMMTGVVDGVLFCYLCSHDVMDDRRERQQWVSWARNRVKMEGLMSEKPKYPGFCEVCVNSLKDYFFCKNSCNLCESEDVPTEFMHEEPPDQFDWPLDDYDYGVTASDWTTGDDWL